MGNAGVTAHALAVTKIEITTNAISAHTYQHEFWAQSAIGPATVQPHKNLFEPGQESFRIGIFFCFIPIFISLT
jgi:hypothetical protein